MHSCKEVSSAVKAGTGDSARPRAIVTRFALFIIDTELYTRHKQSPWTIQYRFAYPRIETLRAAMSCLSIPFAWNPSLVNTRRSHQRSRRSSVDSPPPTCHRETVFKQRRVSYTPWFFFHLNIGAVWGKIGRNQTRNVITKLFSCYWTISWNSMILLYMLLNMQFIKKDSKNLGIYNKFHEITKFFKKDFF